MNVENILKEAVKKGASDIFIVSGAALAFKIGGKVLSQGGEIIMPDDTREAVNQIFTLANISINSPDDLRSDMDFSFSIKGTGRFRANIYHQRGSFSAVLRCVPFELPDPEKLKIPESVMNLTENKSGIVLVTGAAGNGKSTTLSCMLDKINSTESGHIITIEDPIEFLHRHKKCIISQREIGIDTDSYVNALRAAGSECNSCRRNARLRDDKHRYDRRGNGSTRAFNAPYDRRGKHDRSNNRRFSDKSAAPDQNTACNGASRGRYSAACSEHRRRTCSGVRDNECEQRNTHNDSRTENAPDRHHSANGNFHADDGFLADEAFFGRHNFLRNRRGICF